MYIEKVFYKNVGPISELRLDMPFNVNGTPKPILFVGENGSGKSLLLSNIVDAFYTMAGQAYTNAMEQDKSGKQQFYKIIAPIQIRVGQQFLYSYIEFSDSFENEKKEPIKKTFEYIFKSGKIMFDDFKQQTGLIVSDSLKWARENENHKITSMKEEVVEKCFLKNVICFFPPGRYEKPVWIGEQYHNALDFEHIEIKQRFAGMLYNPITVIDVTKKTLQWILDIIVDSRTDIEQQESGLVAVNVDIQDLVLLSNARKNIETILSDILGQPVFFGLNFRSDKNSRFNIKSKQTKKVLVPTLDSLSTGQMALFNIFSTIIRYADSNDINKSINISDITGIVVIDEVELHLHAKLQREVLPKLIKRFPKIQFIITSHSPLFLLGMKDIFGSDGYKIFQMPLGTKIDVEMFSEFQKAYEYFTETQKYQEEISIAITDSQANALIVTEGTTDWKHMKAAFNQLKGLGEYQELFEGLTFDFLEYEPKNSNANHPLKLEMGKDSLCSMCESHAKIPQSKKIIFIADNDDKITSQKLGGANDIQYKDWGNKVYSMVLPIPVVRQATPLICIEHLYSDNEIKTEIMCEDGINRRLFMGNEFDSNGIAENINRFCQKRNDCGNGKINIIEGAEKERVIGLMSDKDTNFALSKMKFADKVLSGKLHVDFSNFIPLFRTLKEMVS